jgi:hypothetical protein
MSNSSEQKNSNTPKLGSKINKELRDSFNSDITLPYEWRIKQLQQLKKMLLENEAKV